jgi:hypothetical protein
MNSHQRHIALLPDARLASMAHVAASLSIQLWELNQLRDRVKKAELFGRRSPPTNGKIAQLCRREGRKSASPSALAVDPVRPMTADWMS